MTEEVDILGGKPDDVMGYFTETEVETTPVETTETAATETQTETPTETPTQTYDWISEFNKSFNTNYTTVEELKPLFGTNTSNEEIVSLKAQNETLTAREQKLIEIAKQLQDPKSYFSDEVEFKKNLLQKTNPSVNREVAGKVFEIDIENANPLDLIVLSMQMKHKRLVGGEAGARETFLQKHGIDADFTWDDLTTGQKNLINMEAEDAARDILALRNSVQLPEPMKDIESLLSEVQTKPQEFDMTVWSDKIDDVVKAVDKIEIKDGDSLLFTEAIDEDFRKGLKETIAEVIKTQRLEPTKENIQSMVEEAKDFYYKENRSQIFKHYRNQIEAEIEAKVHKKVHNDTDPDKATPAPKAVDKKNTDMRKVLGIS